jgi:hypothetical protein
MCFLYVLVLLLSRRWNFFARIVCNGERVCMHDMFAAYDIFCRDEATYVFKCDFQL